MYAEVFAFCGTCATALATNAVVAIWVVFVPAAAVVDVGVPVNAGLARGAASVMPYPVSVVGLLVTELNAGVTATATPVAVIRPLASTVNGVTAVAELL